MPAAAQKKSQTIPVHSDVQDAGFRHTTQERKKILELQAKCCSCTDWHHGDLNGKSLDQRSEATTSFIQAISIFCM